MTPSSLPKGVTELDELEILVVVDNETDTLSSVDEGVPQVPEVVHVAARRPRMDVSSAEQQGPRAGRRAAHTTGLSARSCSTSCAAPAMDSPF